MLPHSRHNEYFCKILNKKCKCNSNLQVYSWGNYVCKVFHTINYFCLNCFDEKVRKHLLTHQNNNKCEIKILGFRNEKLPFFLKNFQNELNGNKNIYLPIAEPEIKNGKSANRGNNVSINNNFSYLFEL